MMDKYRVVIPWVGVTKGDIIETDSLSPALFPNVELVEEPVEDRKLEVATPGKTEPRKDEKK